jgi:hypothetical protein
VARFCFNHGSGWSTSKREAKVVGHALWRCAYGKVRMIMRRSSKSTGMPCGDDTSVPCTIVRTLHRLAGVRCGSHSIAGVAHGSRQADGGADRLTFTVQVPRFVAKMTIGARVDSSARWRYVKHSISNMCT